MIITSLLVVVTFLLFIYYLIGEEIEGFWGRGNSPRYCPNCGDHGPRSCMRCHNCGWSISGSGHGECLPGGPRGPLFSSDTISWRYGGDMYVPDRQRYGPRHIPYDRHRYHNPWWHFW